jgi:tetratricopeptide (TPR) repeat protein
MQNFELALLCFEKSIEILPNQASFFYRKAEVLNAMEKYEDTIHNLNQAILLQPDSNGDFYFLKANALIDMHNSSKDDQTRSKYLEEAIECFELAVIRKILNILF